MRITGPIDSPSVTPDVGGMLKKELENELKRQLTDKLFGSSKKDEASAEGEPAGEAGEAAEAAEEPAKEEDLEDVAKRALFDLLNK